MTVPHPTPEEVAALFVDRVWNARDLSILDEIFDDATVTHQLRSAPGPVPSAPRTPQHLREELRGWFAAFPDVQVFVEQRTSDGDLVTSRYRFEGTHQAPWYGIEPTGRRVVIRMVHTQRVDAGRVREDWLLADWYGVLEQLGVLPPLHELLARAAAETPRSARP